MDRLQSELFESELDIEARVDALPFFWFSKA